MAASVRIRLTVLAVLLVGAGLVAGSAILLALVENDLAVGAEITAKQRARDTAALVAAGDLPTTMDGHIVQVVAENGKVIAASHDLRGLPPLLTQRPADNLVLETLRSVSFGEGGDYLVVGVRSTYNAQPVAVYAATSLEVVSDGVEATTSGLTVAVPVLLAIIGAASWFLVKRALRPVEEIRRQVAEITASELDRRVPVPQTKDELSRLAMTMNEMLARLQDAHERQRRFVGDAAHELRSPLAAIRTQVEVGLAHPTDTDWITLARDLHREGTRMDRLADELLALSSADGDRAAETVDLDELVLLEVEAVRARARVPVDLSTLSAARLNGRPDQLRGVIRNLLDNAERHAHSMVTVGLFADNSMAELIVSDDGDGIPAEDRERVFDRFSRLQPARDRDSGGAGLGLAIVRDVVTAHDGNVWIADTPTGATFHVRLPLSST
ncbi:sensor histidine kinase [Kibdelosporangium aridum]|uniref:histidine kinase n=1 Tax=Kibdelosporangium aridum TaxID=2030 RepID=A0A428ZC35_KIBAR|nr:HAMP domain-containing sensor histidine kinase [Kibdelosporangium aridum]RSM85518.1 sensor histidine kinase [Kibdelosporangium aridum]